MGGSRDARPADGLPAAPGSTASRAASHDGYTTNLALEDFAADGALLAHSWSGAPLEQEHGGPVRLVVPHLYFWKSAKWLQSIEFLAQDAPGYWEVRGYHNRGDPWTEQRYSGRLTLRTDVSL
jgi:DMSO/TMAO reductase YedYZ molybdopterin-dependent catalytic subunit